MEKLKAYVTGRGGRREFWIWTVASLALTFLGYAVVYRDNAFWSLVSFFPWVVYGGRRLRDFNASPWWVVFPIGSGFVIGFVTALLNSAMPRTPVISPVVQTLFIGLVSWSFIIYVGSRRSLPPPEVPAQA